jgi:hypothetical protein
MLTPQQKKLLKEFNARENARRAEYLKFLSGQRKKWEALQPKKSKPKKSFWKWW